MNEFKSYVHDLGIHPSSFPLDLVEDVELEWLNP